MTIELTKESGKVVLLPSNFIVERVHRSGRLLAEKEYKIIGRNLVFNYNLENEKIVIDGKD